MKIKKGKNTLSEKVKKTIAFFLSLAVCCSMPGIPLSSAYQSSGPVTLENGRYIPTVPAVHENDDLAQTTVSGTAQEILRNEDASLNPDQFTKMSPRVTHAEIGRIIDLWMELTGTVEGQVSEDQKIIKDFLAQNPASCIQAVKNLMTFLIREGSQEIREAFSEVFIDLIKDGSVSKFLEIISTFMTEGQRGAVVGRNPEVILTLAGNLLHDRRGYTTDIFKTGRQGIGLTIYPVYQSETSNKITKNVADGLEQAETYIKGTVSLAKENIDQKNILVPVLKNVTQDSGKVPLTEGPQSEDGISVLDSIYLGKEMANTHILMNPPKGLHPYMRWLLYERRKTPEMIKKYVAIKQKINQIYLEAKAGKGKIRYNGKIYDLYLPLPDEMGGTYELVTLAQDTK